MTLASTVNWTANFIAVITALTGLVGAVTAGVIAINQLKKRVSNVHELVNGQLSDIIARADQLEATLKEHGVPVPPPRRRATDPAPVVPVAPPQ